MKPSLSYLLLALALALVSGCSPSASSDTGSAQLTVSVPQGLASTVTRVSVIASASDFEPLSTDLTASGGTWSGTLGIIPAGTLRTFRAQAFGDGGTLLFEGSVSGITITAGQTALVALLLQEVNPGPPFQNEAPLIGSLAASTTSVPVGGSLTLAVTAHDPNPGDTLTYAWTATGGTFSTASTASTSWTAPASSGIQTLTLTVTDPGGLSSTAAVAIHVLQDEQQGSAQLSVTFNRFPSVTAMAASPTLLAVGQATSVSATASDPESDALTYAWTASCSGTWTTPSAASAQFTPSDLPTGACNNCRLTVAVTDGRGGSTTGSVALCVSNAPRINHFPPRIANFYQSSATANPSQVITFEVTATDPEASTLTFAWSANIGTAGPPFTGANGSRIPWTAPPCAVTGEPTVITATVTNAFQLTATRNFTVTGLPPCTSGWAMAGPMIEVRSYQAATLLPNGRVLVTGGTGNYEIIETYDPASNAWTSAGLMTTPRSNHTATLLPNGKVLIAGGSNPTGKFATAELYSPPGSTVPTGAMGSRRSSHQAVLLPNGKVLVAGGSDGNILATAELYDPATGTWSPTGSMAQSRVGHTMAVLSTGKVLVTGGIGPSESYLATAELYDPATGTWSPTGSMALPHNLHTLTVLPSGKVLITGGTASWSNYLAAAELYDPATGTWSSTGSMGRSRSQHTATLLSNGQVFVTGGSSSSVLLAEVYDPATGTWSTKPSPAWARVAHTAVRLPTGKVLIAGGLSGGLSSRWVEVYTP
ncbi:Kelch repeat-containing protein [Stigmatella erecta]|uniref:Galactose oxidase, central domain n=1 Tax=Stigmatella erecta TaxID=83460 RepID=A0A1I0LFZ6_9BACT|nr:kelch repeat-containing protein [Stigmatella erecta]SEU38238.1 Galactose oxidase, central domain [Stigmatella erecta]